MSHDQSIVPGLLGYSNEAYNGKRYLLPLFDPSCIPIVVVPDHACIPTDPNHPILRGVGQPYDFRNFLRPRTPIVVGSIPPYVRETVHASGLVNVLDLPVKMPGTGCRLPWALGQIAPLTRMVMDLAWSIDPEWFDRTICYLTTHQGSVGGGILQREAPVHVDGLQGARWTGQGHPVNLTFTVGSHLPTVFYPIPFNFVDNGFDIARHDAFWEMNACVADDNSAHTWQAEDWDVVLMDAYCGHRGSKALKYVERRTWLRFSFETRIFDRLGNAHNPHFDYAWKMVPRDIEQLGLMPFRPDCDPSLRVFPWQALDGTPLPPGFPKTRPNLRPRG